MLNATLLRNDADVLAKLDELGVELIVVDDTLREERIATDLKRADRTVIPVNLIYPPNYPEEPAILLESLFSPEDALIGRHKATSETTLSERFRQAGLLKGQAQ